MLIKPTQDSRDAQINVRVSSATKEALQYFARRLGKRKAARLAEEAILEKIEEIARQEGAVLVKWRFAPDPEKPLEAFLSYKPGKVEELEKEEPLYSALFSAMREEGLDPSQIEPGIYVFISSSPTQKWIIDLFTPPEEEGEGEG